MNKKNPTEKVKEKNTDVDDAVGQVVKALLFQSAFNEADWNKNTNFMKLNHLTLNEIVRQKLYFKLQRNKSIDYEG